ncbi:amino acid ABC transporter substrate-binding protein [Paucibacter sp. KBW04]|uniref:substrate-binding periplasmic protein n=1 Tax=Paucibacter sp. KBW04 TaxID=2153361 RepID=UPI000F562408|nr:ABC transporter substrate-binding protein [Paucibacter sp. KBW04]RQO54443.1 amino acid ABC transporter substrate-binding protein [Paucibacter sp. KBW04]
MHLSGSDPAASPPLRRRGLALRKALGRLLGGSLGLTSLLLAPQAQAGEVSQRVLQRHSVRVCIWPGYVGISHRSPRTQKLSGIDIDLSAAFAKDLDAKLEYVETNYARFIDDLLKDRCDIAMFGIGVTPQRQARLSFSAPYLKTDIYALTTRYSRVIKSWDDIDKPGVKVAAPAASFIAPVMAAWLKQAQLVQISPPQTNEMELEAGRVDVFMTDFPYSQRLLETNDWLRRLSPPSPISPMPYAYAVKPGDAGWLARVDRFVADIKKDGRLAAAAQKYRLSEIMVRN